jgi:hypothetical protein
MLAGNHLAADELKIFDPALDILGDSQEEIEDERESSRISGLHERSPPRMEMT